MSHLLLDRQLGFLMLYLLAISSMQGISPLVSICWATKMRREALSFCDAAQQPPAPRSAHLAPRTAGTETKHATAHLYLSMELMCTVYCVCQDRLQNGALEKLTCRWEVPGQLPIFPSPDKRYTSLRKSRKDP